MTINRRILIVVVCLALIICMSCPVFASASKTFFTKTAAGFSCTGSGTVSDWSATAVLNAVSLSKAVPPEYATCETWVMAYDSEGNYIGASTTSGNLRASATYISETEIDFTYCSFEFTNIDLGGYTLNNS